MKIYRRFSWLTIALLLVVPCLQAYADTAAPIRVKNSLPIAQGSGLSSPKAAVLMDDLGWGVELHANVQSHANDAAGGDEVLVLDGEVQSISALLRWKFSPRWQANVELSGLKNTGGAFDGLIDQWHDTFGLSDGDRDLFAQDRLRFQYGDSAGTTALLDQASGLGDIEVGLAFQALKNDKIHLSVNVDLNLSTGASRDWLGSDKTDYSVSVALSSAQRSALSWHANLGLLFIGDKRLFGAPTESSIGFTSLGVHWQANNKWRWTAQLDGHQAAFKSAIPELNKSAWQLALGVEYAQRWQLYFAEDLSVNRAADFTVGLAYKFK